MSEKAGLDFEKPKFGYDELADKRAAYRPDPERFPHDALVHLDRGGAVLARVEGALQAGVAQLHRSQRAAIPGSVLTR